MFYDERWRQITDEGARVRDVDADAARAALRAEATDQQTSLAGKMNAAVLLISGCQDNQTSLDGDHNGAFTEQLLRIWDGGRFNPRAGTDINFHGAIKAGMPASQTPNLFTLGPAGAFSRQR